MKPTLTLLSDTSAAGGLVIGLSQIYTILGIILTIGSIIVLIINFIFRMYDRFKSKKPMTNEERANAAREMLDLANQIVELQNQLKDLKSQPDEPQDSVNDQSDHSLSNTPKGDE